MTTNSPLILSLTPDNPARSKVPRRLRHRRNTCSGRENFEPRTGKRVEFFDLPAQNRREHSPGKIVPCRDLDFGFWILSFEFSGALLSMSSDVSAAKTAVV
jgi:hypothetical protein